MATMQSSDLVSSGDEADQQVASGEQAQDQPETSSNLGTPSSSAMDPSRKPLMPVLKRRRVTRACDECRKKKIKCDGKQPCTHCTVYSYECTFNQPSNRRRNPAPAYIEALEIRLQKAEAVLRTVLPGVNLDDPQYDAHGIDQIIDSSRSAILGGYPPSREPRPTTSQDEDTELQTMVESTGMLELDDQGHWDYHGTSSGFTFMRNLRAQFGDLFVPDPRIPYPKSRAMMHLIESPKSASSSPYDLTLSPAGGLPNSETALRLCQNTLEVACALIRFVHKPTFYRKLNRILQADPDNYTNDDTQFLPLLYVVMAVGSLFAQRGDTTLDTQGYESAIKQGFRYYQTARNMLDITDCRDIQTLQAIVFMIMFLQSSAKLATCYSYIGIALRSCCRLGLHRNIKNEFNPIEQEERKRIFWVIRKMDIYVGAMLGLPQLLSDDDVDQELPISVDDEYITQKGVAAMPSDHFPLMTATNAHTRLVFILQKVVKFIYPMKPFDHVNAGHHYSIPHSRIREIEKDLQTWMDSLPMELRPSEDARPEVARVQQLLRLSYAHVQMVMYRPFLHYLSQTSEARHMDKRSYACAAACVSVARNIIHVTAEMTSRGLLIGSHWFVMYTSYFSVLSLVYFVFENPQSFTGKEILKDATEGRRMLARLAKGSLAADRCSHSLEGLFAELPTKLKERKISYQSMPPVRKRPNASQDFEAGHGPQDAANTARRMQKDSHPSPDRVSAFPVKDEPASTEYQIFKVGASGTRQASHQGTTHQSEQWDAGPLVLDTGPGSGRRTRVNEEPGLPSATPFGDHLGDSLPDLTGLMYPSSNPFEYGKQPLSILEDAQVMAQEQQSSFPRVSCGIDATKCQAGMPDFAFEGYHNTSFGNPPQQDMYQQRRQNLPDLSRTTHAESLQALHSTDPQITGNLNLDEAFWQQMGNARTGLTPSVTMDEVFGADGGWNPMFTDPGYGGKPPQQE